MFYINIDNASAKDDVEGGVEQTRVSDLRRGPQVNRETYYGMEKSF